MPRPPPASFPSLVDRTSNISFSNAGCRKPASIIVPNENPSGGFYQIDRARPGLMAVFLRHANEDGDVAQNLRGAGDVMGDLHRGDLPGVRQAVDSQLAAETAGLEQHLVMIERCEVAF